MTIEAGIQLHLPSYHDHTLSDLIEVARAAGTTGFDQLWVTDNIECRNVFVTLAALAPIAPIKLGTAIMAQYFRSPIEAVTSLVPVSELMDGREFSIGLGTGNTRTHRTISMPRPIGFMKETALILKRLTAGESIAVDDYPLIRDYFNFTPGASLKTLTRPAGPVSLFCGGNGPLGLALGGRLMDGLLFGWTTLPNSTLGLLSDKLAVANDAAERAGMINHFRRITELKISISRKHEDARSFVRRDPSCARRTAGLRRRGYTDDQLATLGIDSKELDRIDEHFERHGKYSDFSELVSDPMIDASYVAGDPVYCRERIAELAGMWRQHGFGQVIFSELGPNQVEATRLIAEELLPELHR